MDNKQTNKLNIPTELIDNMLTGVRSQDDLWGKNGIMTQLNKAILERILDTEMDFHLSNTENGRAKGNSRNGHGKKNVHSTWGEFELITPRDRHSTFEPQIVPKRTTRLDNLNDAILSLYARGMTVRDIQQTLHELYHFDVSPA